MDDGQQQQPDEPPLATCNLCGELKRGAYGNVCEACVVQTLRRLLPDLVCALEDRYGQRLDEWVASGRFTVAAWEVELDFKVSRKCLLPFLISVIREAFRDRTLSLELPHADPWAPADAAQVAAALDERFGEGLCKLLAQYLAHALRSTPTLAAERELIEVASGRKSSTRRRRKGAVDAAAFTIANPLRGHAAVLLHLRYGAGPDVGPYTDVWEGELDSVWWEIEELLPEEVRALLPKGESGWP